QRAERAVEPAAGGGAARVLVDDVAGGGLVDGRHHDRADRAALGPPLHRLEQLARGQRLVRDDEHDGGPGGHACTSSSTGCLPKTAWRAPGTPYSYGPPTTCGISSKLNTGGGDDTCHSIVFARHGFGPATGPRTQLVITL